VSVDPSTLDSLAFIVLEWLEDGGAAAIQARGAHSVRVPIDGVYYDVKAEVFAGTDPSVR
jgi:hypothetical protein